ncbi:MAG TPA: hypothetical protein VHB48_20890 [Chitinophagaceae bacterium]|nr:hypothetical protein [Chitinophagaceae bacterium]
MKLFLLLPALLATISSLAQKKRKVSAYISFNVNATQYDRTITNNATGFGAGLQLYIRTKSRIQPVVDISADVFGGTKELYLDEHNNPIYAKNAVSTVFAGAGYQSSRQWFATLTAGPAFFNSHTYAGIKPLFGYYLLKGRQLALKAAFTNIFQRDATSNQSFGYWNFYVAVKLF